MYFGLKNATTNIRAFGLKLKKKKKKKFQVDTSRQKCYLSRGHSV